MVQINHTCAKVDLLDKRPSSFTIFCTKATLTCSRKLLMRRPPSCAPSRRPPDPPPWLHQQQSHSTSHSLEMIEIDALSCMIKSTEHFSKNATRCMQCSHSVSPRVQKTWENPTNGAMSCLHNDESNIGLEASHWCHLNNDYIACVHMNAFKID